MITSNLKKRFCRDTGVNIQLYAEPYFTERLELLGYKDKWDKLVNIVEDDFNGNEEQFLAEYNSLKDSVIDFIQKSEAFRHLNTCDMSKYKVNTDITSNDIYKSMNVGKEFISIDMAKANFSSLVSYAMTNELVFDELNEDSFNYEKFMRRFTDNEHFINSKYIRQVIFGACNPKRQVTYEKCIMYTILSSILGCKFTNIQKEDIVSFSNDEIVIEVNEDIKKGLDALRGLCIILGVTVPLHFEYFKLGKVTNSEAYVKEVYYSKLYMEPDSYNSEEEMMQNIEGEWTSIEDARLNNKTYIIKKANPMDTVFIQRILNNQEVTDNDLVFWHEGRLAKLLEKPDISIVFE